MPKEVPGREVDQILGSYAHESSELPEGSEMLTAADVLERLNSYDDVDGMIEQIFRLGELVYQERVQHADSLDGKAGQALGFATAALAFLLTAEPQLKNHPNISFAASMGLGLLLLGAAFTALRAVRLQPWPTFHDSRWFPRRGEVNSTVALRAQHLLDLFTVQKAITVISAGKARWLRISQILLVTAALGLFAFVLATRLSP